MKLEFWTTWKYHQKSQLWRPYQTGYVPRARTSPPFNRLVFPSFRLTVRPFITVYVKTTSPRRSFAPITTVWFLSFTVASTTLPFFHRIPSSTCWIFWAWSFLQSTWFFCPTIATRTRNTSSGAQIHNGSAYEIRTRKAMAGASCANFSIRGPTHQKFIRIWMIGGTTRRHVKFRGWKRFTMNRSKLRGGSHR